MRFSCLTLVSAGLLLPAPTAVFARGASTPVAAASAVRAPALGADPEACIRAYAMLVESEYRASLAAAEEMRAAIRAFCGTPSDESLARARETWIAAREIYGRTEAFRFGNGPIDSTRGGNETFLNAWPVDESYIEPADANAATGIIRDAAKYPALGRAILRLHNQRGGETNVCTGWHAIEFMLWGRDLSETGPGARPAADFADGGSPHAERRREFLLEITDLLCEDLERLAKAWAPDAQNHRARFERDAKAMKAILVGPALLAGFEMSGERLAVALETRDQEEEHSCFSDTTDRDFKANMRGIAQVLRVGDANSPIEVVRAKDAAAADALAAALASAESAVAAIPAPFDASIRKPDGSAERERLARALEAVESLGEAVTRAAKALGYELPTEPQG